MIDLLRLRVSQFRQDRILEELFVGKQKIIRELKRLRHLYTENGEGVFDKFEEMLSQKSQFRDEILAVIAILKKRLRRDTDVVLRIKVRNISELLEVSTSRISFQNAFLVFLLYHCGGFVPSNENNKILRSKLAISQENNIERHGVDPMAQIERMVSETLYADILHHRERYPKNYVVQHAISRWPGGYFGYAGKESDSITIADESKRYWRKEHLPGTTSLFSTVLCGAVAAIIDRLSGGGKQFRVTLHRTLSLQNEELLQQTCDYVDSRQNESAGTAGRTFRIETPTIGAAYRCRKIIRTIKGTTDGSLDRAMNKPSLLSNARKMRREVNFVLAIPLLQPEEEHYAPSPVTAVLYLDSEDDKFWIDDEGVREVCRVVERSVRALIETPGTPFGRIRAIPLEPLLSSARSVPAATVDEKELEILESIDPPSTGRAFVLNLDHTDLAPVVMGAHGVAGVARN